MLSVKGSHFVNADALLGGNVYLRQYRNRNTSSNVNDGFGEPDPDTGAIDTTQALNDRSVITQTSYGAGVQLTLSQPLLGRKNRLVLWGQRRFRRRALHARCATGGVRCVAGNRSDRRLQRPDRREDVQSHARALLHGHALADAAVDGDRERALQRCAGVDPGP
jgi:hypothetical protein